MSAYAVLLLAMLHAASPDPVDVDAQLRRAKNEYAYGNYEAAATQLRALLYPLRLTTDAQVIEARKYLAIAYYLQSKPNEAVEELGKLLYLSPDYELDPYTISPPIIELFERVRKEMRPQLDAIRQRRSDERLAQQQGFVRTIEQTMFERSDFATLMPFGAGQFQNGDVGWGAFFAVSELLLLGLNIGAYLWAESIDHYRLDDDATRKLVQRLTVTQYAAAGLFGVTWSLGVLQARLDFQPLVPGPRIVTDEPLGAHAGLSLRLTY